MEYVQRLIADWKQAINSNYRAGVERIAIKTITDRDLLSLFWKGIKS